MLGFAALTVVGDGDGGIGMGKGKAKRSAGGGAEGDGRGAPQDGQDQAEERHAAPRRRSARHGAAKVLMQPASDGTGIIAGGAMRAVFEVMGVTNVLAKCFGSNNPTTWCGRR